MLDVLADNPVLTLFLAVGLGSALGLVPFGPIRFGPAGALFVGLALGALDDRLGEGPALADALGAPVGRRLLLAGAVLAVVGPALLTLLTHRLGMSPARSGGLIAGFVGNPSLLAFATGRVADERVNEGYATLFALDTILKVLLVQVIVGLGG